MAKGGIGDLYVKVGKELHSKKTLDNVPVRWRSAPDHPETQLAYITDEEAALLKQLDIHNSGVRYNHHIGPLGIPSYNGAGSGDSAGDNSGGGGGFGGEGGSPAGDTGGSMGGGDVGGTGGSPAGDGGGTMGGGNNDSAGGSPAGDGGGVMGGGDANNAGGSPAGDGGGVMGGGGVTGGAAPGAGAVGPSTSGPDQTNSLQDALGQTAAGAFSATQLGVTGVPAGMAPDVSTALSTMGLGDVTMGALGIGGIMGTGTDIGGVSGLGGGAGNMTTGGAFSNTIGDALGNIAGPVGFGTTMQGFTTDQATSTPFGGAPTTSPAYSSPSLGMGFGVGPTGFSMGAPYAGASLDTGMLATGGIPGSRPDTLSQQQSIFADQQAAVTAARSVGSPYVGAPGVAVSQPSQTVSQALSTPATAVSFSASTPAATVAAQTAAQTASQPTAQQATGVSPTVSAPSQTTSPTQATTSPTTGPSRSASSISQETFADPLTGATVSVTTNDDGTVNISSPDQQPGWGQSMVGTAVNLGLGLTGLPGLIGQGLSYGLTGQSAGTNVANAVFGQGFSPVGGLLGGGPTAGYDSGPSNPNASQGEGGGGGIASLPAGQQSGYNLAPTIDATSGAGSSSAQTARPVVILPDLWNQGFQTWGDQVIYGAPAPTPIRYITGSV